MIRLCDNSLSVTHPHLVQEWDYKKNGDLRPDSLSAGSKRKVWWTCSRCSYNWQSAIYSRAYNGCGCPVCGRKKQTESFRKARIREKGSLLETNPILCEEWNYSRNINQSPQDYSYGSNAKVWWICKRGHEWKAVISSRVKGSGCPKCNAGYRVSLPEKAIVYYLIQCNIDVVENAKIFGDSFRDVDIYIPSMNCAIEYDGEHWHKNRSRDLEKTELCKANNIRLIRIREPKIGLLDDGYSEEHLTEPPKSDLGYINRTIEWLIATLDTNNLDVDANRDMPQIRAMIEKSYDEDSFGHLFPELAVEWDCDKNGKLSPNDISKCSGIRVWWLCSKHHSWQDTIAHRIYGRGCPYCSGKRTLSGFNDLKTRHPDIVREWDYEKNFGLDPSTISDCNSRRVWWICPLGHSYSATIAHRTSSDGTGCPYCSNQKVLLGFNDLYTKDPLVANEWNTDRNQGMTPQEVTVCSNKKVWWTCSACGFEWQAAIYSRTKAKSGCPVCSSVKAAEKHHNTIIKQNGSLIERNPDLSKEWDYDKNGERTPDNYSVGSKESVWWKCSQCGHSWQARISNRSILGRGCPACAIRDRTAKKKKGVICLETNRKFDSINSAAEFVGVSPSKISACCLGKQKTAGGFRWKYNNINDISQSND